MKRILLTSVLVPMGLAIGNGCAVDDSVPQSTSTGVMGTAGENGTAGNDTGAGGNDSTGAAGKGNPTTGASGDMTVGAGGNPMGAGGNPMGAGGMAGAGVGGMGGSAGGGMMDVADGKSNMGFQWKDSWFITGCAQQAGHDCVTIQACPNGNAPNFEDRGSVVNETFPLGGVMGTNYAVTFKYNGISEGKFMQGGAWAVPATDAATAGPANQQPTANEGGVANDTFYIGGTATASNYNVMRIRVMDSTMKEVGRYYMNGYPQSSGAESHRTFAISYSHTITVPGKGFVEYHIADSNCHAIDNCGPGPVMDGTCTAARSIPNEPNAVLPAMYTDVSKQMTTPADKPVPVMVALASLNPVTQAKQPWHSQIGHFTITNIVAK